MSFPLSFSNFSSRPVAVLPLTKEFMSSHALTQPVHSGWDMRQQLNFASLPCPELWPALHAMLDPTPPARSSLFSPVVFWPASSHRINTSSLVHHCFRQLFFGRPLHAMLELSPPALSSLLFASCIFAGLFFSSQLGSILRQLWVLLTRHPCFLISRDIITYSCLPSS